MLALLAMLVVGSAQQTGVDKENHVVPPEKQLSGTELVLAFAVFRHGDRTPDEEETTLFPNSDVDTNRFFPYGMKALTNRGKVRGYRVGQFLRTRYDGFISRLFLPDELELRCTDYDRTKMTALTAMAALYPPQRLQKWNPVLDWQPVPYNVEPKETCEFLYWYNCPAYLKLRNEVYRDEEVTSRIKRYNSIFRIFTNYTGANIKTTEDVFYLDNLFQAEENVGVKPPAWSLEYMPAVKEITKLEYEIEFYTEKMIQLAFGVTLKAILDTMEQVVRGKVALPKLYLYSAHENNVAAMMAATNTFYPHQPEYGSTYALELRRINATGTYVVVAAYSSTAGMPAQLLPIAGCGGDLLCDYHTFVTLTRKYAISSEDYANVCNG